ncbi:MAG: acetate/propionate family kinase [Deltaproteobacteria bacterium]
MHVLVINCGSSSVKYRLLEPDSGAVAVQGKIERVASDGFEAAVAEVLQACAGHRIDAVGHRVVHGGDRFFEATRIDAEVEGAIEANVPLAPLHNPANLAGIRAARAALPDAVHVAVFDTAFHNRMPRRATTYAIDPEALPGARRYGFHGTSHQYVARLAAEHLRRPIAELRLISCHLGNGASVCAVEYGHSVETSMGMTPLEGLVMGTRSGDLDPGLVLSLARAHGVDETDALLNQTSGLSGLSGVGRDLRDVEAAAEAGNDRARLAITVFAHRVKKYIGAYAATMGGVDAIVLTGGIGENAAAMRRRILQRLDWFGVVLDEDRNAAARVSDEEPVFEVSASNARTKALVVKTNEERRIAQETAEVVRGAHDVAAKKPIPIAVSARHIHLTKETFASLFGPDAELTKYKDISQPGQYASEQKVTLVGPRARIEGVRVLGPLRPKNQIEISRTDEFKLGVDAPVRRSGHVEASAPITLEGPAGTVHLEEGLICAWRHIHMTPEDAELHGVKNGDNVEVAVRGGPRDLVFGDVLVRVSEKFVTEMHIDTDEANAAEIMRGAGGELIYTPADTATAGITSKR